MTDRPPSPTAGNTPTPPTASSGTVRAATPVAAALRAQFQLGAASSSGGSGTAPPGGRPTQRTTRSASPVGQTRQTPTLDRPQHRTAVGTGAVQPSATAQQLAAAVPLPAVTGAQGAPLQVPAGSNIVSAADAGMQQRPERETNAHGPGQPTAAVSVQTAGDPAAGAESAMAATEVQTVASAPSSPQDIEPRQFTHGPAGGSMTAERRNAEARREAEQARQRDASSGLQPESPGSTVLRGAEPLQRTGSGPLKEHEVQRWALELDPAAQRRIAQLLLEQSSQEELREAERHKARLNLRALSDALQQGTRSQQQSSTESTVLRESARGHAFPTRSETDPRRPRTPPPPHLHGESLAERHAAYSQIPGNFTNAYLASDHRDGGATAPLQPRTAEEELAAEVAHGLGSGGWSSWQSHSAREAAARQHAQAAQTGGAEGPIGPDPFHAAGFPTSGEPSGALAAQQLQAATDQLQHLPQATIEAEIDKACQDPQQNALVKQCWKQIPSSEHEILRKEHASRMKQLELTKLGNVHITLPAQVAHYDWEEYCQQIITKVLEHKVDWRKVSAPPVLVSFPYSAADSMELLRRGRQLWQYRTAAYLRNERVRWQEEEEIAALMLVWELLQQTMRENPTARAVMRQTPTFNVRLALISLNEAFKSSRDLEQMQVIEAITKLERKAGETLESYSFRAQRLVDRAMAVELDPSQVRINWYKGLKLDPTETYFLYPIAMKQRHKSIIQVTQEMSMLINTCSSATGGRRAQAYATSLAAAAQQAQGRRQFDKGRSRQQQQRPSSKPTASETRCFKCQQLGHMARDCTSARPAPKASGTQVAQQHASAAQPGGGCSVHPNAKHGNSTCRAQHPELAAKQAEEAWDSDHSAPDERYDAFGVTVYEFPTAIDPVLVESSQAASVCSVLDSGTTISLVPSSVPLTNEWTDAQAAVKTAGQELLRNPIRGTLRLVGLHGQTLSLPALKHHSVGEALISLRGVLQQHPGWTTSGNANHLHILDEKRRKVMTATVKDNKYVLDLHALGLPATRAAQAPEPAQLTAPAVEHLEEAETAEAVPRGNLKPWHAALGHPGATKAQALLRSGNITGTGLTAAALIKADCLACKQGKQTRLPFSAQDVQHRAKERLERVYADVLGIGSPSLEGHSYVLTIIDDYSGYSWVLPLKLKSDVREQFIEWAKRVKTRCGRAPAVIRTDQGGEFSDAALLEYWRAEGARWEPTLAYTPQHNGRAERLNRTLLELTRTALIQAGAARSLWHEAMLAVNYIRNLTSIPPGQAKTARQLFFGDSHPIRLDQCAYTWGCDASVNVQRIDVTHKLDPVARTLMYAGPRLGGGHRFYELTADGDVRLHTSRDARFNEHSFTAAHAIREHLAGTEGEPELSTTEYYGRIANENELKLLRLIQAEEQQASSCSPEQPTGQPSSKGPKTASQIKKGTQGNLGSYWQDGAGQQLRRSARSRAPPPTRYGMADPGDIGLALSSDRLHVDSMDALQKIEQTLTDAYAAAMRAPGKLRPLDQELRRQQAIRDATENKIVPANEQAQCNKKGEIATPSQQCTAGTKRGTQCGARTKDGHLCWQHLKSLLSLRIKPSEIEGAGRGLFTTKDIPAGAEIVPYTGDLRIGPGQDPAHGGSLYVVQVKRDTTLDAARKNTASGRLINHATGQRANVRFVCDQRRNRVRMQAIRRIPAGTELLVNYGPSYFNQLKKFKHVVKRAQRADRRAAINEARASHLQEEREPANPREAMSGAFGPAEEWQASMKREVKALTDKGVYTPVTSVPEGTNLLGTKWVYKRKRDQQGKIVKYKSRLVAQGFTQIKGVDYDEIFAPVIGMTALRTMLAWANAHDYEIKALDFETAYLNAPMDRVAYAKVPVGYDAPAGTVALRIDRAQYGLHQSGRLWYQELKEALRQLGYKQAAHAEQCIVTRRSRRGHLLVVGYYVDDLPYAYHKDDTAEMAADIELIKTRYKLEELGDISSLIGIRIQRDRAKGELRLDQACYVLRICREFGFTDARYEHTPESTKKPLLEVQLGPPPQATASAAAAEPSALQPPQKQQESNNKAKGGISTDNYASAIGALMYAANGTRPDIAHAVNQAARFTAHPTSEAIEAVKRVFRYLNTYPTLPLVYTRPNSAAEHSRLRIEAFSDADWAGDALTARSTGGALISTTHGAALYWSSKRQPIVALSSTEAEYIAASECCRELISISNLLTELGDGPTEPIPFRVDNQTAIRMIEEDNNGGRRKHINVRYHFIRQVWQQGLIQLVWTPTAEQLADVLTKPLSRAQFTQLRDSILGIQQAESTHAPHQKRGHV